MMLGGIGVEVDKVFCEFEVIVKEWLWIVIVYGFDVVVIEKCNVEDGWWYLLVFGCRFVV